MPSQSLNAAIAATRFGFGGRPGEIAAANGDPVAFLADQIRQDGADQPLDDGEGMAQRMVVFYDYAERKKTFKKEQRANYQASQSQGGAPMAATGAAPDMAEANYRGMVNKKGKPLFDANGQRLIRPKQDAGVGELHKKVVRDVRARLQLAATTDAAFRERWTQFWINHFTVGSRKPPLAMLNAPYEREAIRPRVFGRFDDMAFAVAHHPTMLLFLDQAKSVGPNSARGQRRGLGLNENFARETFELHTLGAESGYTQEDVTEFARALTGFTIANPKTGGSETLGRFIFDEQAHEPGARIIMGVRYDQSGERQPDAILRAAATDPRTAHHISRKLAAHFVADDPAPALVHALEQAWIASRGDLGAVARALVRAPEAWTPAPAKFKTPYEFLVSCYRAGGGSDDELELGPATLERFGQKTFSPPSPKGWPDEAGAWATSDAIIDRLDFASSHAATVAGTGDPLAVARAALGARLTPAVAQAMQRAESRPEALTLLYMSPEFQRR